LSSNSLTILYADDEAANLTAFKYCFGDRFEIITVQSGEEALAMLGSRQVAVLLADQRMPGMTGVELCTIARERFPDVVRMIVTAYADISAAMAAINSGQVSRYILKPWREDQMAEILRAGIEAYDLGVTLRELQVKMLQAEQQSTMSYLLGRVLHELAQPMTSLLANATYLADSLTTLTQPESALPPALRETFEDLRAVAKDTALSADELAARVHRFRNGETPASSDATAELTRAVHAAVAIVGTELRKRARLTLQLAPVPAVAAEATQVSQIVVNLLMNAVEAIEPGRPERNRITVRTSMCRDRVVLEIEDTGAGISAELLPRVFEPFVTTKSQIPARGFGLAVVQDLVQRLKGEIRVRSELGTGTCFIVELPAGPH
jgi:two-component system NtrC family sensor kinase